MTIIKIKKEHFQFKIKLYLNNKTLKLSVIRELIMNVEINHIIFTTCHKKTLIVILIAYMIHLKNYILSDSRY